MGRRMHAMAGCMAMRNSEDGQAVRQRLSVVEHTSACIGLPLNLLHMSERAPGFWCASVYVHARTCACVCAWMCMCMCVHMCVHVCVHVGMRMCVQACVCVCVCAHLHACAARLCVCARVRACGRACVCVCVYTQVGVWVCVAFRGAHECMSPSL